jgi:hypothetical protein
MQGYHDFIAGTYSNKYEKDSDLYHAYEQGYIDAAEDD